MSASSDDEGKSKAPLGIVKKTEEELAEWVRSESGFLQMFAVMEGEPVVLDSFQQAFLEDGSRFRWITKARQVGFSFVMALEALARCHLRPSHSAVMLSYSLEDAKNKVAIARQVYESIPLAFQKKLVIDSRTELGFASNAANGNVSRIISNPSKAPRGKRGDCYLDELAHYALDREVYTGSTALILRSNGQLTGCSTPLGRRGIFWEIASQEYRQYPHHTRMSVPWWLCRFFCTDVERAGREAFLMPTEERVATFGLPPLIEQFDSLPLEDFQQEFENSFLSEVMAYFSYDLILPCTHDELTLYDTVAAFPRPEGRLVAGYDVGRTRDRSELAVFEEKNGRFVARMLRSFDGVPFDDQQSELRSLLNSVPLARLSIDSSGIGMHMAENLARDFPQVVKENFSNDEKERWATNFKILLQRGDIELPRNRELVTQIHSIRRRVLPSGKVSFESERTRREGHADRFWAIALACQREREPDRRGGAVITMRVIG